MGHEHGHHHSHKANKKALLISFIVISVYMIVEAIGGFLTNSLALLADAGHMLSDAISLGIALLAFTLGEKAANYSKTYGYKRLEILAAVFNGLTLILISGFILFEAFRRFQNPPEVASAGMLMIAAVGLLVNIFVAWLLMSKADTKENLNMRAAFLHVLGDLLGSVGAVAAALLIIFFGWNWADPFASVIVAVLILISGTRVTKESLHVLMEGTPKQIDFEDVINQIQSVEHVASLHDLHIWSITSGQHALSCHVVVDETLSVRDSQKIIRAIEQKMEKTGISHVTLQLETSDHPHKDSVMCQHGDFVGT